MKSNPLKETFRKGFTQKRGYASKVCTPKLQFLPFVLVMILVVSGCVQDNGDFDEDFEESSVTTLEENKLTCVALCLEQKGIGADLSSGPCLGNDVGETPAGEIWVCDVAHDPRQDVDNLPENQCPDYRAGIATHFVEVDEDCNVIRAV